ncbi:hypothetical protein JC794_03895 [Morganella morganii]|uniref:hypothetical protein n=1 Tax=Morganella TaxID=581 RepID=UPI001C48A913|nr:hypothetical protein [Morganella morganii]QXO58492.1 hypothetical protein JC827_03895 [Morganella morganii]QXO60749.1 hypothetical protein JC826_14875 [Morganella morganii]QXO77456.1 hypothetical protein JC794_03895 [Morganella morganii]
MKKYLLGIVLALTAVGAMAVDGYKGVKFGSSFEKIKSAGLCSFVPYKQNSVSHVSLYQCTDFRFSGKNTIAMVSLLDNKFSRLVIVVNNGSIQSLYAALSEKYGEPSFLSSSEEVQQSMVTGEPVYVKFDNDTVIIKVEKVNGIEVSTLIYTVPDFEQKVSDIQKNNISDDI